MRGWAKPVHLPDDGKNGPSDSAGNGVHVVQRGNHRDTVLVTAQDRQVFLKILHEYSERYQLRILGYCLKSNHYHIICLPIGKILWRRHSVVPTPNILEDSHLAGFTFRGGKWGNSGKAAIAPACSMNPTFETHSAMWNKTPCERA
jgi:hypothetical protein